MINMKKIFNLKKFRKEHNNLTQEKFAEIIGISQSDVSRYENDPNTLPFYVALNIAHIYGIASLEDFLNDELENTPSISMENLYSPFSKHIMKYQEKISSFVTSESKKTDFEAAEIYFSSCLVPESILLFFASKPTVSFIDISGNAMDRRNMLSNILGLPQIKDFGIPVFYVDSKSRPTWTNTDFFKENERKDLAWLNEDILYLKKPLKSFFDVKALNSLRYTYYSKEDYDDILLNPNENGKENAECAVIFVDSDLLQNINILSLSKNATKQYSTYSNIADIKIAIGSEIDLANIKINENEKSSVLRVSVGVKKDKLPDKTIYTYHPSSEKDNEPFYNGLKKAISENFNLRTKKYKEEEKEIFEMLKASFEDSIPKTIIKADSNLILSKKQNLIDSIKLSTLNIQNNAIKELEKIYYEETDTKEIKNKLDFLGNEMYKENDEKKYFPCNKNDLEKTKKTLFEHLANRIYKMHINKKKESIQKTISIIENYKDKDELFYVLNSYKKGLQSGLESYECDNNYVNDVEKIFSQIYNINIEDISPSWEQNIETPLREIFYNKALKSITTFARGFSLSKARKISKALQNFSVFKEFKQVFEDWWNEDFSSTEQIISELFDLYLDNDSIPHSEKDLHMQKEILKEQIKILEELQDEI